jgi:hypothetical protein
MSVDLLLVKAPADLESIWDQHTYEHLALEPLGDRDFVISEILRVFPETDVSQGWDRAEFTENGELFAFTVDDTPMVESVYIDGEGPTLLSRIGELQTANGWRLFEMGNGAAFK